jgi:nucleotide-binding universal stress UspA family protein
MAISAAVSPAAQRREASGEVMPGILVATDGREQSDVALRAGCRLVAGGPLGVLTVLPPHAAHGTSTFGESAELIDAVARQTLVEAQVLRVLGDGVETWIEVRSGYPPAVLAASAALHRALLVAGIGRPRVMDRLRGDESALRLIREARTPILAVAPLSALPPRRLVIAMDFSESSLAAARLALGLAAPSAEVIVAHIAPRSTEIAWGSGAVGYHGDPALALENHVRQLTRPFDGRLRPIVVHGDAASELLDLAMRERADLIAVGARGHGPLSRVAIGAVTTRIVRCATCSVLVAPRDATTTVSTG